MKILTDNCLQCNKGLVHAENKGIKAWKVIWCSNMECQNPVVGQGKNTKEAMRDYNKRYKKLYGSIKKL